MLKLTQQPLNQQLTVSYANNGAPTPITKAAKVPPTERQVYKLARSLASKP